jgi:hypothetical protein
MEDNLEKKELCLVCFDEFNEINPKSINLVECECKFNIHGECWMNWMNFKHNILECPICHKYIEDTVENIENLQENEIDEENQVVEEEIIDYRDHQINKIRFICNVVKILILIYSIFFGLWLFS